MPFWNYTSDLHVSFIYLEEDEEDDEKSGHTFFTSIIKIFWRWKTDIFGLVKNSEQVCDESDSGAVCPDSVNEMLLNVANEIEKWVYSMKLRGWTWCCAYESEKVREATEGEWVTEKAKNEILLKYLCMMYIIDS